MNRRQFFQGVAAAAAAVASSALPLELVPELRVLGIDPGGEQWVGWVLYSNGGMVAITDFVPVSMIETGERIVFDDAAGLGE